MSPIKDNYFFNGKEVFLIGRDGNILKTEDTGQSWTSINSGVVEQLWDIDFINESVGFVVGEFGRILKTEDRGETWRKTNSGTQENIYSIAFKNELEGWVGTDKGLRYTVDGGETWLGVPMRYQQGQVRYVEFDSDGNGYAYTPHLDESIIDGIFSNETGQSKPAGHTFLMSFNSSEIGVNDQSELTEQLSSFKLNQNYPNPFNNTTRISYHLLNSGKVSLAIYNIQGQLVRNLVNDIQEHGEYSVNWDGRSETGRVVSSGVYLYLLESDEKKISKKMLYLK